MAKTKFEVIIGISWLSKFPEHIPRGYSGEFRMYISHCIVSIINNVAIFLKKRNKNERTSRNIPYVVRQDGLRCADEITSTVDNDTTVREESSLHTLYVRYCYLRLLFAIEHLSKCHNRTV